MFFFFYFSPHLPLRHFASLSPGVPRTVWTYATLIVMFLMWTPACIIGLLASTAGTIICCGFVGSASRTHELSMPQNLEHEVKSRRLRQCFRSNKSWWQFLMWGHILAVSRVGYSYLCGCVRVSSLSSRCCSRSRMWVRRLCEPLTVRRRKRGRKGRRGGRGERGISK